MNTDDSVHHGLVGSPGEQKNNVIDADHMIELGLHQARVESRLNNTFKSCCGLEYDKRIIMIFMNIFVSVTILVAGIYGIYKSESCEDTNLWSGFISVVLGYWLSLAVN